MHVEPPRLIENLLNGEDSEVLALVEKLWRSIPRGIVTREQTAQVLGEFWGIASEGVRKNQHLRRKRA